MKSPSVSFLTADLRIKCLCGCGEVQTYATDLEWHLAMSEDVLDFEYFVVTFGRDPSLGIHHRIQVRGETAGTVFAFPCLERIAGEWHTRADGNEDHFAMKAKEST